MKKIGASLLCMFCFSMFVQAAEKQLTEKQYLNLLKAGIKKGFNSRETRHIGKTLNTAVVRKQNGGKFAITDKQKEEMKAVLDEMEFPLWWDDDGNDKKVETVYAEFVEAGEKNLERKRQLIAALLKQRLDAINQLGNRIQPRPQQPTRVVERVIEKKGPEPLKNFKVTLKSTDNIKKGDVHDVIQARDASEAQSLADKKWGSQHYRSYWASEIR